MAFVRPRARILEISTTSGNGPYTVPGAGVDLSHNSFASFMNVGDSTEGYVAEPGVAMWTGILTRTATNQITLTTVEETKGTFGAGTKEIGASPLASRAMLREDIAGAIVTGGSSSAYTVSSFRVYGTLAQMHGQAIAFTPHVTNAESFPVGNVTLNVDGLGEKPLRGVNTTELRGGTLIQGTPYVAVYNHIDGAFYLQNFFGNPYSVPLGSGLDYWGPTAPNSAFAFPIGQDLDRTTYAGLFAVIGTTYGSSSGSTFKLPDKTGRVSAMKEASATRLTVAGSGINGAALGSANGLTETHTLTTAQLAGHSHGVTDPQHAHGAGDAYDAQSGTSGPGTGGGPAVVNNTGNGNTAAAATGISINSAGGGGAHNNVQPTIICNYILRVI
jgi:microcystin-dependent protein